MLENVLSNLEVRIIVCQKVKIHVCTVHFWLIGCYLCYFSCTHKVALLVNCISLIRSFGRTKASIVSEIVEIPGKVSPHFLVCSLLC